MEYITSDHVLDQLDDILSEDTKEPKYKAAVAVVRDGNKWLLGLSTAKDDRQHKWTHPAGGIKNGETPEEAAVREAYEETGIRVKAIGKAKPISSRPEIAFVPCKVTRSNQTLKPNNEFVTLAFFKIDELRGLKLYSNAKDLIERVK